MGVGIDSLNPLISFLFAVFFMGCIRFDFLHGRLGEGYLKAEATFLLVFSHILL